MKKFIHLYHKQLLLLNLLIYTSIGFSQVENNRYTEFKHLKFDKGDGYIIDDLNSMEFDENGWLWLSGIRYEARNYKLGAQDLIIVRFNGQTFYELKIPEEIINGASNLVMQKSFDNSFYLKLEAKENSRLFKIDAQTLAFKEIKLPEANEASSKYEMIKLKEQFLFIQQDITGNNLFYLNNQEQFIPVGKMATTENLVGARALEYDNYLIISKFNFGSELYQKKDELLINKTFPSTLNIDNNSIIEASFYQDSTSYVKLKSNPKFLKYDITEGAFTSADFINTYDHQFYEQVMFQDSSEKSLLKQAEGTQAQMTIFSNLNSNPVWSYSFENETTNRSIFASRDLSKEVILDNYNTLEVFIFDSNAVTTLLNDLSIRSMTQIDDKTVLIATDFNGWFIFNLDTLSIEPYWPLLNKSKLTPQLNRDISFRNNTIWSNDHGNILKVNSISKEVKNFQLFHNISAMTQTDSKVILADVESNVKTINKSTNQIETLITKDSVQYENLIVKDKTIYAATSGGLKIINQKNQILVQPKNNLSTYFVAMYLYGDNHLLLGSKSGELYKYTLDTREFELLYQDDLAASIATILIDDSNRIWMNTFAGLVAFNPQNNETIRLGINDGLSHYEANRFSALKLKNGSFMVGTVKGLNLFYPDDLITSYKNNIIAQELKLISVQYFDTEKKEFISIIDQIALDSLNRVKIPAENKMLLLDIGILKPSININYSYRYRFDQDRWVDLGDQHEIKLLNLEAGNYNLQIQALDKTKNQVISTKHLRIEVARHFYESVYFYICILVIALLITAIYMFKWKQVSKANYKNKLLKTEIEYKKKDLTDFANNISRNQQWNDYLISKMEEIKEAKGRKKGAALIHLENEIRAKNNVEESSFEFQKRIDVLSNEFYNTLLEKYPKLSKTEIKLCSLIRLNLDAQDIATLQNVDISSVYKSRYRLRKKLNLQSETDLDAFLKSF